MTEIEEKPKSALRAFLDSETSGGLLLIAASAVALLLSNSPFAASYASVLEWHIGSMSLHMIINDLLMALFFLLVGLEIKREFTDGQLATWEQRRLPIIAAAFGMAAPAFLYVAAIGADPAHMRGWAIPAATDIAFALAVLGLLGPRVPLSLKLFLTTVAIVDDLGAVAIIAIGYTEAISGPAMLTAILVMAAMFLMNRWNIRAISPYLIATAALWYAVHASGVHATVAGVLAAMMMPVKPTPAAPDASDSVLHRVENLISRPVAWLVLPLFGLANAGVALSGTAIADPLVLAIIAGLFFGKQFGVFGAVWLLVHLKWATLPKGASWTHVYGVALLCGIGFTMSLFIGDLAFGDAAHKDAVRIGVLAGSLLSALAGYLVLRFADRN